MLGMKNHFDISGSIEIAEVDIAGVACICLGQWPIFCGTVILPYIFNTIWWTSLSLWILVLKCISWLSDFESFTYFCYSGVLKFDMKTCECIKVRNRPVVYSRRKAGASMYFGHISSLKVGCLTNPSEQYFNHVEPLSTNFWDFNNLEW